MIRVKIALIFLWGFSLLFAQQENRQEQQQKEREQWEVRNRRERESWEQQAALERQHWQDKIDRESAAWQAHVEAVQKKWQEIKFSDNIPFRRDHLRIRAQRIAPAVQQYAAKYKVNPQLVMAIIHTESSFNPMLNISS
jgi:soluble lytic murein transglycosylase-like protein